MKATLEFNLADPADKMAHFRCVKSLDMALAIWDLLTKDVYADENTKLIEILEKYSIDINELVE